MSFKVNEITKISCYFFLGVSFIFLFFNYPPAPLSQLLIILDLLVISYLIWDFIHLKKKVRRFSVEQKLAQLGQSTAEIFHDIKNPLTAASLSLEKIDQQLNTDQIAANISTALNNIEEVKDFIYTIQHRLHNYQSPQDFSPLDEIKHVINFFYPRMKNEKIHLNLRGKFKGRIHGFPDRFSQVVSNLLANAIDAYFQQDKKQRKINVALIEADNDLVLTVQDFGMGMSQQDVKRIFEPYFSTKDINGGTGLGMYVVKDVVENYFEGRVKVESELNKGTTVTVTLPLNKLRSLQA